MLLAIASKVFVAFSGDKRPTDMALGEGRLWRTAAGVKKLLVGRRSSASTSQH